MFITIAYYKMDPVNETTASQEKPKSTPSDSEPILSDADDTRPLLSQKDWTLKLELKSNDSSSTSKESISDEDDKPLQKLPAKDRRQPVDQLSWWNRMKFVLGFKHRMCGDCRAVRSSSFTSRVFRLMRSEFCFGCRMFHPELLFSADVRHGENKGLKKCILWHGKVSCCPHISMTWEEFQEIKDRELPNDIFVKRCAEPDCEDEAWIAVNKIGGNLAFIAAWKHQFTEIESNVPDFTAHALKFLRQKYRIWNKAFCPDMQRDPSRLDRPDLIASPCSTETRTYIKCAGNYCLSEICLMNNPISADLPSVFVTKGLMVRSEENVLEKLKMVRLGWRLLLDEDDRGFARDLDLKNITWCDDITCITSKDRRMHRLIFASAERLHRAREAHSGGFRSTLFQVVDGQRRREDEIEQAETEIGRRENIWMRRRRWFCSR